ncbi:MAG: FadR family transcriptional regulator [Clostridia bacterium]|nr:FadR family transcriptional regulator [Clostridia bacterium]
MTHRNAGNTAPYRQGQIAVDVPAVKKRRLSKAVSENIAHKIYSAEWHAGQTLPSERVLAGALGVSRTVLREALAELSDQGYIGREGSRNWIVLPLTLDNMFSKVNDALEVFSPDLETVLGLMDIRMLLENYTVGIAAESDNTEEIRNAQRAIDEMRERFAQGSISYESETVFHSSLVRMTGNKALISVYNLCKNLLNRVNRTSLLISYTHGIRITAMDEHQRILDAIVAHDREKAMEAMREHLILSRDNMIAAYQFMQQETWADEHQKP